MPAPERDYRTDRLYDAERPRALQEAIDGTQYAAERETQHVPVATVFQRVTDEHPGEGEKAEPRERVHGRSLQKNTPPKRRREAFASARAKFL